MLFEESNLTPPLIIIRSGEVTVYNSGRDIEELITDYDALKRSNAFVIYDPDGSLWNNHAMRFSRYGYILKSLNLSNLEFSSRYNPMMNFYGESGGYKFATALINGTKGLGKPRDVNFTLHELKLLNALISYIYCEVPQLEWNMESRIEMLNHMIIEDYEDGFKSAIDVIFYELGQKEPCHSSVRLYAEFKDAAGNDKQAMKIAASCIKRVSSFNTPEMLSFMYRDDLWLESLPKGKTALFVQDGDAHEDIKLLVPLMYSQFFEFKHRTRFN